MMDDFAFANDSTYIRDVILFVFLKLQLLEKK